MSMTIQTPIPTLATLFKTSDTSVFVTNLVTLLKQGDISLVLPKKIIEELGGFDELKKLGLKIVPLRKNQSVRGSVVVVEPSGVNLKVTGYSNGVEVGQRYVRKTTFMKEFVQQLRTKDVFQVLRDGFILVKLEKTEDEKTKTRGDKT